MNKDRSPFAERPRVVITRRWPDEVEQALRLRFDVRLSATDLPMSATELRDALRTADALLTTVSDAITAEVLHVEPLRARIIANFGVGFNHIDIDVAAARGVTVTNTPEVLTDCTADLCMSLLLMVARRAGEGERHVRGNAWTGWRPTHMLGTRVTGKTLGLVGFGRIARAMAHRAHFGFDMEILYYTPRPPPRELTDALHAVACSTPEELLSRADFVSLHCPGGSETRHLINAQRLAAMKPGAYLINTARGEVVDQEALMEALDRGVIAGAALDVYEDEPRVPARLKTMEKVVLLPHLGSATRETRTAMGMRVLENLDTFFAGGEPPDRVA